MTCTHADTIRLVTPSAKGCEGYDPPEGWGWCFVDEEFVELPDQTSQIGPIPRFVG